MTWRQAITEAVAILEEQGIYGGRAEAIAKDLIRLGERIDKARGEAWRSNWRDRD